MSDISVPGVNGKYDKLIESEVKLKKIPLDRMKDDVKNLEANKKEWQDVTRLMNTLRNSARAMFNQDNPFTERKASSPDPAIGASASREAAEGTTRVQVVQLAQADRFGSRSLEKNQAVPEGNYTFSVGNESFSMRFRGGTVREFAEALTRRADGRVKASIIQNRPDSQILVIESQKTGSAWPLKFKDDALKLALDLGMLEEQKGNSAEPSLALDKLRSWDQAMDKVKDGLAGDGTTLTVKPGAELSIPLPAGFAPNDKMVLEYQVRAHGNPANTWKPPPPPPELKLTPGPSAVNGDIVLPDLGSPFDFPKFEPPKEPQIVVDDQMLWLAKGAQTKPLPPVADSADFQTVRLPLKDIGSDFSSINVRNRNSLRDLELKGLRVYDPTSRGDYKPANAIASSQDAVIRVEGIDIIRDTNTIKDAIPGVTLTLNATTDKPVPVKVEPDRKLVKDKVIEFVANYNAVITEINIASAKKDNTDVVSEIDYWDDKKKEEAMKRLGMFQGEMTLNMIKNRLQVTTASAYQTSEGQLMSMLNQAGVSTNASAGGGDLSTTKLRGYLEINEQKLDKALAEHFLSIKELFGKDTNGDLLPDSGVGVELDKYIQPYVQVGGIMVAKTSSIDTQLRQKNTDIKNYEVYLRDFEQKEKQKYGEMEGAVNRMQQSSRQLQSLNNSGNKD